jgi:hypothetical protein
MMKGRTARSASQQGWEATAEASGRCEFAAMQHQALPQCVENGWSGAVVLARDARGFANDDGSRSAKESRHRSRLTFHTMPQRDHSRRGVDGDG